MPDGAGSDLTLWFNPQCSKCRGARDLLDERGISTNVVRYLEDSPTRAQLEHVLTLLGTTDPRAITRTGEPLYRDLHLAGATREELLDALASHPILIERPIAIRGDRAVIGRPAERVLELLDG